ncbi:hypothetical protein [Nostoc parmelioides]|uniref:Site-specific DNA-cytosine methylase n=1 Tax=Nostoc parmelioides FACHB-3921 TaxID=2692909 RepID=A0ABR8BMH0_9NOSO|nr:hypothetical protein [Nostoc parmelioides]MBD2255313.1 hypothetical protein [Nostoc parmelioides FACHB-3921]
MNQPPSKRKKATSTTFSNSTPANNSNNNNFDQDNPANATITVTAIEIPELSEQEQSDRLLLERKVERAFFEAGKALRELRDRRLYRSTHRTFEEYCRDRFAHSRQQSNYLIAAAEVYENLTTIGCQNLVNEDLTTNRTQVLPTTERQVRPLTKLEPQEQEQAWQQAVEEAGGKVPSARIVTDVVQRIMERTQVTNSYHIGEVCQILAKDNPELRGKGCCWGIVTHVGEFSCTLRTWDTELTVGLKHLKSFDYLPQECEQMQQICDRLNRIYSESLEETVKNLLQSLGKLNRPYLTAMEDKLLNLIELEYDVIA